ncbi:Alpha/Beta hydrolase protein [Dendryphion nanum]|uniref:Alpha/Beta hydrolase protein n=1 Tax=Dendryphion nanum TaxID=256645 RepID=A0A9P9DER0_9PLEO|nr:Alpha/Beta hydrolase protein [Dendryphion nanum]
MATIQDQKFAQLGLQKATTSTKVVAYHKGLNNVNNNNPILVLLHGYPQSSYIWRHLIPLLRSNILFVPDLPGYGQSAPANEHDKVSIGLRVLEALKEVFASQNPKAESSPPIVLIGHDRGARVAHALHVSAGTSDILGFKITGIALFDIVPTTSQWAIGDTAAAQTGFFHWSFLANVRIAKEMITAYGGGKWALDMIDRWSGSNITGLENLKSGDALKVYSDFFDQESIIEASCRDYEAGATVDVERETEANKEGRKIVVPLLLVYSEAFLPKRARKPIVEVGVTDVPVGDGIGHFVAEEAPEVTAQALKKWLETLRP